MINCNESWAMKTSPVEVDKRVQRTSPEALTPLQLHTSLQCPRSANCLKIQSKTHLDWRLIILHEKVRFLDTDIRKVNATIWHLELWRRKVQRGVFSSVPLLSLQK